MAQAVKMPNALTDEEMAKLESNMPATLTDEEMNKLPSSPVVPAPSNKLSDEQLSVYVAESTKQTGVPSEFIHAIIETENPQHDPTLGNIGGHSSAMGLGQIIKSTAESLGVDPTDPQQSAVGIGKLLKEGFDKYGDNTDLVAANYFLGSAALDKALKNGEDINGLTDASGFPVGDYIERFKAKLDEVKQKATAQGAGVGAPSDTPDVLTDEQMKALEGQSMPETMTDEQMKALEGPGALDKAGSFIKDAAKSTVKDVSGITGKDISPTQAAVLENNNLPDAAKIPLAIGGAAWDAIIAGPRAVDAIVNETSKHLNNALSNIPGLEGLRGGSYDQGVEALAKLIPGDNPVAANARNAVIMALHPGSWVGTGAVKGAIGKAIPVLGEDIVKSAAAGQKAMQAVNKDYVKSVNKEAGGAIQDAEKFLADNKGKMPETLTDAEIASLGAVPKPITEQWAKDQPPYQRAREPGVDLNEPLPLEIPSAPVKRSTEQPPNLFEKPKDEFSQFPKKKENMGQAGAVRIDLFTPENKPATPGVWQGRTTEDKIKGFIRNQIKQEGNITNEQYQREVLRRGTINSYIRDVAYGVKKLKIAAKKTFMRKPSEEQLFQMNSWLAGESPETIPTTLKPAIQELRSHMDGLSKEISNSGMLTDEMKIVFDKNNGIYMNRSYKAFEPGTNWAGKVRKENPEIVQRAKDFFKSELAKNGEAPTDAELEGLVNESLFSHSKTAPSSTMEAMGKLSPRITNILKHRQDIPVELRALWGEHKNPYVNYANTVAKSAQLLENFKYLKDLREIGLKSGMFKEGGKPIVEGKSSYHVLIDNPSMKPLNGLYTTPEIHQALLNANEVAKNPAWLSLYMKGVASTKYAKTVLSPASQLRNFTSNILTAIANGHINPVTFARSIKDSFADLRDMPNSELRAELREWQKRGVINSGVLSGEVKAVLKEAMPSTFDEMVWPEGMGLMRKTGNLATRLYQLGDDIFKLNGARQEFADLKKAFGNTKTDSEIRDLVGQRVRATYPTYDELAKSVQSLKRFPFVGPFVSYPAAIMQNMANRIGIIASDFKAPETRGLAIKRGIGTITALGAGTAAANYFKIFQKVTGAKDDESKVGSDEKRRFLPPWSQNSEIVWLGKDKSGHYKYIDLGFTDPHSLLKGTVIAAMHGKDPKDGLIKAATNLAKPFVSPDIFSERVGNIAYNKRDDGKQIYNPEDSYGEISKTVFNYMLEGMEPGAITSMRRVWKGIENQKRSSDNQVTGRFGSSYNAPTEAVSALTGVRVSVLNPENTLMYKAGAIRGRLEDVSKLHYKRGDEVEFKKEQLVYDDFREDIKAAKHLGLTNKQVFAVLNSSGISKTSAAILSFNDMAFDRYLVASEKLRSAGRVKTERKRDAIIKSAF